MKKIFAIALCFIMVISFAACGGTTEEPTAAPETEITEVSNEETTEATVTEDISEETSEEVSTEIEETSEVVTEVETTVETTIETTKEAKTEATTKAGKETTTKAETTEKEETKVPSTKEEIIAVYNEASKKVSTAKPGFTKKVVTKIPTLEMGALAKISVVREAVGSFLGEGENTNTIKKGAYKADDMKVSALTAADVQSATCKLSADGKYYDITITVKNESNVSKKNSAISRCTSDYKDADEMRQGLIDNGAEVGTINLSSTNVVIKAKISVADSKFSSLSQNLKFSANLSDVKYSIAKVKTVTGTIVTDVTYSSFAY